MYQQVHYFFVLCDDSFFPDLIFLLLDILCNGLLVNSDLAAQLLSFGQLLANYTFLEVQIGHGATGSINQFILNSMNFCTLLLDLLCYSFSFLLLYLYLFNMGFHLFQVGLKPFSLFLLLVHFYDL